MKTLHLLNRLSENRSARFCRLLARIWVIISLAISEKVYYHVNAQKTRSQNPEDGSPAVCGVVDRRGLFLYPDEDHDNIFREDDFLSLGELMTMDINARLVVLSAGDTGTFSRKYLFTSSPAGRSRCH